MIIGITGAIAAGKSTVTSYLSNKDVEIIDADKIAHELIQYGTSAYKEIILHFGENILDLDDETINRRALGEIVFNDPEQRKVLDGIMFPKVQAEIEKRIKSSSKDLIILDVPLLFEIGWEKMCDQVWFVFVDEQSQIQRLMKRNGFNEQQALARINSQMSIKEKLKRLRYQDIVIDNSRDINSTIEQVNVALHRLGKYEEFEH